MKPKHIGMQTPDGAQLNLDALYQICPSCFTEVAGKDGKPQRAVDWDKLRALLGDAVADGAPEVYDFTWVGKRAAQREAAAPTRKTLRPCPEESVDWENTQNLYIEGDNLEVLKLLQNSYMGKVKMIYIDPPYNTGNDFVYHDDFAQSAEEYDESNRDEEGNRYRKNTDSNGRFHSDWCSMMYARLMVARSLLSEDGVIFISMDDNEIENLRKVSDEVFGEQNFQSCITWRRRTNQPNDKSRMIAKVAEYILVYAKNNQFLSDNKLFHGVPLSDKRKSEYTNPDNDPKGPWSTNPWKAAVGRGGTKYEITTPKGITFNETWYGTKETFESCISENRVHWTDNGLGFPRIKIYLKDAEKEGQAAINFMNCDQYGSNQEGSAEMDALFDRKGIFDNPKPTRLLKAFQHIAADDDSIILDFFSGSATTANAVMQLNSEDGGNRKFIMVQLPEETASDSEAYKAGYKNICEIGKERIRRAGKKIKDDLQSKARSLESTIDKMLHATPDNTVRMLLKEQQKEIAEKIYKEQIVPKQIELDAIKRKIEDLDIGFRVFKCESSIYKDVAFAPKDYTQDMLAGLLDNIKEDRTDLDLLFDCMLRWGVELSLPLSSQKVDGCTIHNVNDGDLVACFDGNVTEKVIDAIAELSPVRVVFRDSSFNEAANKMNLFELFKQKCDWTDEEVKNNVRVI